MTDAAPKGFSPRSVSIFFALAALIHLVSIFTRFDALAAMLPNGVDGGLLVGTIALLLVEGIVESRVDYGEQMVELPLWMQIKSKPIKLAFTFGFTYLAIVLLQTLDLEIGPIDPSPPEEWDLPKRLQFFAMMSVGMFFPNYLAASGGLIPALRVIASPLKRVPFFVALIIGMVAGIALGFGAVMAVSSTAIGEGVAFVNAIEEHPVVVVGTAVVTLITSLVGTFFAKSE